MAAPRSTSSVGLGEALTPQVEKVLLSSKGSCREPDKEILSYLQTVGHMLTHLDSWTVDFRLTRTYNEIFNIV